MRSYWWIVSMLSLAAVNSYAYQGQECKLIIKAEEDGLTTIQGKPPGQAVIYGKSVKIPSFKLTFHDAGSGQILRPEKISVAYGWKWLEYPYPEHSLGAWSDASDIVECARISGDLIEIPQFDVNPRGWYNGKYVRFPHHRKPSFTGIDIVATLSKCTPRITIGPNDVRNVAGRTVIFKVNCQGQSAFTIEK
jgi:hypothetical protein